MSCCKYSASDLKHWVEIGTRDIQGVDSGTVFSMQFAYKPLQIPVKIRTVTGRTVFDGTGIERVVTHEIVARYDETITSEMWMKYKNNAFKILTVENIDEEDEWLKMNMEQRGDADNVVNHA